MEVSRGRMEWSAKIQKIGRGIGQIGRPLAIREGSRSDCWMQPEGIKLAGHAFWAIGKQPEDS